ncbi:MAG: ankyrin repeat domain-containing protein [Desulfomonilaceae bacterium]
MLLQKGTDVNAKANRGNTALMRASKKGHSRIVEALKAHAMTE